jgi:hypothetical protein
MWQKKKTMWMNNEVIKKNAIFSLFFRRHIHSLIRILVNAIIHVLHGVLINICVLFYMPQNKLLYSLSKNK